MTKELIDIIQSNALTEERKVELIQAILCENPDLVNAKNEYGETPLYIASQEGYLEVVKALLAIEGIDVNAANNRGWTPLFTASEEGLLEVVKELLKHNPDVNSRTKSGHTPLIIAANRGYIEVIKELDANGADINAVDKDGWTALRYVVQLGSNLEAVKVLLGCKDINVNIADQDCKTPLLIAVQIGKTEDAQLIIEHMLIQNFNETKPDFLNPILLHHWTKCHDEIKEMQKHKVGISLFDILVADENKLASHMNNKDVVEVLSTSDYKKKFPICASRIERQVQKGMECKKMQKHKFGNSTISLFDILIGNENKLASHMNNKDVVEVLSTSDYKEEFPIFASRIERQFQRGMWRKCALNPARNYFSNAGHDSTIPVVQEKFNWYIFDAIFKHADNALLKAILSHRDELTSVGGTRNLAAPAQPVEDDNTVNSRFSDIRVTECGESVTQQNKT
ncbi:ankyrin repeat domain-containing protein [Wolbachia endosymbiont of Folsomia candida]|uniref:ankyrin repeat domain-containing protein n=1 Tax=Wolbachia endosymbiont of Folsomia candida TaxID=169402 RepID=UPI000B189C55|nr:ankyrin repeat domain-containing protein [Wolbachia endosymbiont of Folsomia candida]APR97946.1 hypothetical protein ASM33_01280 [Wolbachia endosymbiont of Folsomia candida]